MKAGTVVAADADAVARGRGEPNIPGTILGQESYRVARQAIGHGEASKARSIVSNDTTGMSAEPHASRPVAVHGNDGVRAWETRDLLRFEAIVAAYGRGATSQEPDISRAVRQHGGYKWSRKLDRKWIKGRR